MKIGVLCSLMMISLLSCSTQEICDTDNQSELVARFKTIREDNPRDTTLNGVTIYGIRPGKVDSLLYGAETAARIVLPLDPNQRFSTFVLDYDSRQDTLTINHNTEYYLISYTCGFAAMFTLADPEHTGHIIKGVEIINGVIDAEMQQNEEHIWIYF
jgi:hypothetical protein